MQVTLGCSADSCRFCGAYKNKPFAVKDPGEIFEDIKAYARWHQETRRVFLIDGDALVLHNTKLVSVLQTLEESFPWLSRVASYANGSNIMQKTGPQLEELYTHKLRLSYMGIESGSQEILDRCGKSSSVEEMIRAVHKAAKTQIKSSVIVLLGLGGKMHSQKHVKSTLHG